MLIICLKKLILIKMAKYNSKWPKMTQNLKIFHLQMVMIENQILCKILSPIAI